MDVDNSLDRLTERIIRAESRLPPLDPGNPAERAPFAAPNFGAELRTIGKYFVGHFR